LARSGQAEPPEDLTGFPAAPAPTELHRLSDFRGVWWYSSVEALEAANGGRFDLISPEGTCYLAEDLEGAIIEKLLRGPARVVVAERLAELFHAIVEVRSAPFMADLTAPRATGSGVNAELHSTLDYQVPRRWAAALRRHGARGLRYLLRGDNTGRAAGRALFGHAGLHRQAPSGMSTRVRALDRAEAERLLRARGVEVRPIPTAVTITDPPS
jgi:hypothetical protein